MKSSYVQAKEIKAETHEFASRLRTEMEQYERDREKKLKHEEWAVTIALLIILVLVALSPAIVKVLQ